MFMNRHATEPGHLGIMPQPRYVKPQLVACPAGARLSAGAWNSDPADDVATLRAEDVQAGRRGPAWTS